MDKDFDKNEYRPLNENNQSGEPTAEENTVGTENAENTAYAESAENAVGTENTADASETNNGYSYSGAGVGETFSLNAEPQKTEAAPAAPSFEYRSEAPTQKKPKKKKAKGGLGAGGIAILVAVCIVVSALAGFGGAYMYGKLNTSAVGGNITVNKVDSNGNTLELPEGGVTAVADGVSDTVVEITTEAVVKGSFFGNYVSEGAGSGVIISDDGYIITNNHVIASADTIKVRTKDGTEYDAKLIATDSQADIAVIKVEASGLHAAILGSSKNLVVGQRAVAIGNPLGELGGTVTTGIISALDREVTIDGNKMRLLQTDAAINPGNSGGGLFNLDGELIGIVNAKSSGDDIEGLGFAIPIDTAYEVAQELISNGYVSGRPALGVSVIDIQSMNDYYNYSNSEIGDYIDGFGVYIAKDERENFKLGDRILAIDETSVSSFEDVSEILSSHKIGDEVTVTVSRARKMVDVKVTLIEKGK